MATNVAVAAFALVLFACVIIAVFLARPKPTIFSFFWGDQRISWGLATSLLLTGSFSLNGLLYQAWLGYTIGWWSLAVQTVWCLSFVFLALNAPKFQTLLSRGTMHGVIASRFGSAAGRTAAFASIVGFSILIGWETVVGATLLKNISGTSDEIYILTPIALALVASLYTALSGLRGDAYINAGQNILKTVVLGLAAFCLLLWGTKSGFPALWSAPSAAIDFTGAVTALGGIALIANLAFSAFWQTVDMSVWQSLTATEPARRFRTVVSAALLVFVLPGLIGSIIGIGLSDARGSVGAITDANILNAFALAMPGPSWLAGVLAALLFAAFAAAMLSTIDGFALAAAQAATWDVTHKRRVASILLRGPSGTDVDEHEPVIRWSRLFLIGVGLFGSLGVMWIVFGGGVSLFEVVYLVVIAQMSLVGPVMMCLFWPNGGVLKYGLLPIPFALGTGFLMIAARFLGYPDLYTWAPVATIVVSLVATAAARLGGLRQTEGEIREVS